MLELERYAWSKLRTAQGTAEAIPATIEQLALATTEEDAHRAYWGIDNRVILQGALHEASEATAACLVRVLPFCTNVARRWIFELLFQLAKGENTGRLPPGRDARAACVREVVRGVIFFMHALEAGTPDEQLQSVDLLGSCALEDADLRPRILWLLKRRVRDAVDPKLKALLDEWILEVREVGE